MTKKLIFALILSLGFIANAETQDTNSNTPMTNTEANETAAAAATPAANLSDNQIARVMNTINNAEIDAAKMAKRKTKNNDIQKFAKSMIKEHRQNKDDIDKILNKNSITPRDSDFDKSLKEEAKNSNKDIKSSSDGFDKAYVNEQVTMHQKALDTLNNTLIPNAKNADLRAYLEKTRDAVASHLEEAKTLQTKFE